MLARHVRPLVDDLLARHGLTVADVDGWAVHPGGPRILDVVAEASWGCADEQMAASRGRRWPSTATARRRPCC